jgi:hypothetical protein
MKVYLTDKQALAYYEKKASADFWDEHWQMDSLRHHILSCTSDGFFVSVIKKYFPLGVQYWRVAAAGHIWFMPWLTKATRPLALTLPDKLGERSTRLCRI